MLKFDYEMKYRNLANQFSCKSISNINPYEKYEIHHPIYGTAHDTSTSTWNMGDRC